MWLKARAEWLCALHWFEGDKVSDITYSELQEHEEDPPTEFDSFDESESENSVIDDSDSDMDWKDWLDRFEKELSIPLLI